MTFRPSQAVDNRSLVRGLEILRAFKPGLDCLTNSELAERTGLPKSTVSRLTGTLVRSGFLLHDAVMGGYRLSAVVVGMAHVMRSGSLVLNQSMALMQASGRQMRVNVGLAVPDHDDMVYLENLPFGPKASLRKIVAGQRVPMAFTSLGRAYLATLSDQELDLCMQRLQLRHPRDWKVLQLQIHHSIESVRANGYCAVDWQPSVVSLATPLVIANEPVHVINMSLFTEQNVVDLAAVLSPALMRLRQSIVRQVTRARSH